MIIKFNKFYVYHHLVNGKIFYVGMGQKGRAFTFERPGNWTFALETLLQKENTDEMEIQIVDWFDTKKEAQLFEKLEITKHQPIGNSINGKYPLWVHPTGWDASLLV